MTDIFKGMPAKSRVYLTGVFLSSLGSMTYVVSLAAFLSREGVSVFKIGILFAALRLNGVLVNAVFGHLGDHFSPRKIIVVSEFFAALGSLLIFLSFKPLSNNVDSWFWLFFTANQVRSFFTNFQSTSLQKLGKLFDLSLGAKGVMAVKMNSVTFGTILFGAAISYLLFKTSNLKTVIVFDFCTFLLNGICVASLKINDATSKNQDIKASLIKINPAKYFNLLPHLALTDILLAAAFSGQNTLNTRLVQNNLQLVPILAAIFGAMVWFSAFLLPKFGTKTSRFFLTICLSGLLIQFFGVGIDKFILIGAAIAFLGYWLTYNRVGQEVMRSSEESHYASVIASRNAISILVLSLGEVWVGLAFLNIAQELALRISICFIGFFILVPKEDENKL